MSAKPKRESRADKKEVAQQKGVEDCGPKSVTGMEGRRRIL